MCKHGKQASKQYKSLLEIFAELTESVAEPTESIKTRANTLLIQLKHVQLLANTCKHVQMRANRCANSVQTCANKCKRTYKQFKSFF